jgi:glycosyltransferase involved in cell wall biosynthesis
VQRPLKMVQLLLDHGYESTVVTSGGEERGERWSPEDATLLSEVPPSVDIRRVSSADEPRPERALRPTLRRWLGRDDKWSSWWVDSSYRVGLDAAADSELIYVWMQPYASAEVGAALSRALDLPWVADLGDPWALDEMIAYPSAIHRLRALTRMRRLLGTASAIVMSTPEAADQLVTRLPQLGDRPVVSISNGFDPADFAKPTEPRKDRKFRIVHTGYLHTTLGLQHRQRRAIRRLLGGSIRDVDMFTRSHVFLIEAINRLIAEAPALEGLIELHLAGVADEVDREVAASCPVAIVRGFVTHAEALALMRGADLLFLPMHNLPPGVRATIVPGKTYEYLASGRPILAAVPDGDARDLLKEAGGTVIVRPDDVEGIVRALRSEIEAFRTGVARPRPAPDVVARFEYGRLAAELAGVFDSVLARAGTR